METRHRDQSSFTIRRALLASLLLQPIVLLILALLLQSPQPIRSQEPEELRVQFDLTPTPEPEAVPPPEESELFQPFAEESNTDQPANPAPSTLGDPSMTPSPPVPNLPELVPEPRPVEETTRPAEEVEAVEELLEEPPVEEPNEPPDEAVEDAADDATETAGIDLPGDRPDLAEGAGERSERRLDVTGAIADLLSGRAQPPPPSEPRESDPGSRRGLELPDLDTLPASGFGVGNLYFESADYDWSDYARQIYMAIWRAWHYRLWVTTDQFERWAYGERSWALEHQVLITFTIQANGQVTDIGVLAASGCRPLDDSATNAMEEVVLQPLPSDFPRDRETVRARFIATGDIRMMKRQLEWYRQAGFF